MPRRARQRSSLTDLGSDLLAAILGKLPDTRSRVAASATNRALWRASCLPWAWENASLALDLNNSKKTSSALGFFSQRGKGLLCVELTLQHGTCSLAETLQRLAPLLSQLPALRELELHSQHLAVLSVVAASLPQLRQLTVGPADPQTALLLPDDSLGLQGLSCLQRLVVSLDPEAISSDLGPLLRGIETIVSLTGLLLEDVASESRHIAPVPPEGEWSPQLTRLQRLQLYYDELGLDLPLEVASLPELRSVSVRIYGWEGIGSGLCALRRLTFLKVLNSGCYIEAVPDPAGFKQALGTLQELHWDLPAKGLHESGRFRLEGLTSLSVRSHLDIYACLLWSPACRLQELSLEELMLEDPEKKIDLTALSPLTLLTYLSVGVSTDCTYRSGDLLLPQTPCLAELEVLVVSSAGMTCIPDELRQAGRLQMLEIRDPELYISRACVATLTALTELVDLEVEVARAWEDRHNQRKGWDWESVENLRLLGKARPDMSIVRR